jgi:hypothetical protein
MWQFWLNSHFLPTYCGQKVVVLWLLRKVSYEVVSVELGYPVRISYSYAYFRVSGPVFRYDNAPHHPHIATFPHHKHLFPEQIVPTDQPTLSQILAEIDDLVSKR